MGVIEQSSKAFPNGFGLYEGPVPLPIGEIGRVRPRLLLSFEPTIWPCLMGMTGEEQALGDPELRVVWCECVWCRAQIFEVQLRPHSDVRIAHRSGKTGWNRVEAR